MNRPIETLAQRLKLARKMRRLSQDELADKAGAKQPDISKLELGRSLSTTHIARLAQALDVPAEWLEMGDGPTPDWEAPHPSIRRSKGQSEARPLSQFMPQDAPLVHWGEHMQPGSEPRVFWTTLPDDSMAPRAPAGKMICFDRDTTPRPGDGVLIADSAGNHYFRVYRQAAAGRWTAHAFNSDYLPMDSISDGLQVLAVLKAEDGRWA